MSNLEISNWPPVFGEHTRGTYNTGTSSYVEIKWFMKLEECYKSLLLILLLLLLLLENLAKSFQGDQKGWTKISSFNIL